MLAIARYPGTKKYATLRWRNVVAVWAVIFYRHASVLVCP
jgi:hypothetical protein